METVPTWPDLSGQLGWIGPRRTSSGTSSETQKEFAARRRGEAHEGFFEPFNHGASLRSSRSPRGPLPRKLYDATRRVDVCVVGAGPAGLAAARSLSALSRSLSVALLERKAGVGGQANASLSLDGFRINLGATLLASEHGVGLTSPTFHCEG